uniref:Uncharacterized protein n=1 Tax=Pararge aegeria TaxID=116150 RepID=S4PJ98_9NEOP
MKMSKLQNNAHFYKTTLKGVLLAVEISHKNLIFYATIFSYGGSFNSCTKFRSDNHNIVWFYIQSQMDTTKRMWSWIILKQ